MGRRHSEEKGKRAFWSYNLEAYFVDLLHEHSTPAYQTDNGWSKPAWALMTDAMTKRFPNEGLTKAQLKHHERTLKKKYKVVKQMKDFPGMGWDETSQMAYGQDEDWHRLIERYPETSKWREREFPHFKKLEDCYEGHVATGKHAVSSITIACSVDDGMEDIPTSQPPSSHHMTIHALGTSSMDDAGEDEDDIRDDNGDTVVRDHTNTQQDPPPSRRARVVPYGSPKKIRTPRPASTRCSYMENPQELGREEERKREAVIEKAMNEDPFSTSKCVTAMQGLQGITLYDIVKTYNLWRDPYTREFFLSLKPEAREVWLRGQLN